MNLDINKNSIQQDLEDNNYTLTNDDSKVKQITYKFFATKKEIPWLRGSKRVFFPLPSIEDTWFEWKELPRGKQIDFVDLFSSKIVIDDNKYTYWKIEKYVSNKLVEKYYYFTDSVSKILKGGYEIILLLDVYLTYTRTILSNPFLYPETLPVKFKRMSLTNEMIKRYPNYYNRFLLSLSNVEENILNSSNTYSEIKAIPIPSYDKNEVETSKFPNVSGEKMIHNTETKLLNIFNNDNRFLPGGTGYFLRKPNTPSDGRIFGAIQIKENGVDKLKVNKEFANQAYSGTITWTLSKKDEKEFQRIVSENIYMSEILDENGGDILTDIENNIKHSYFAVFRNGNGTVDCYPILGKVAANFYLPLANKSSNVPGVNENNQVGNNYCNRVYCNYKETKFKWVLQNDWESIYSDYVKNLPNGYSVNSFIGIYKGILASGSKSKLSWVLEEYNSEVSASINGTSVRGYIPKIKRMMYQLTYQDFIKVSFRDYNFDNNQLEKFNLFKSDNFIKNYIDLLEPLQFGLTEIIPARYSFLADMRGEFEINKTMVFLDSFYLFLNNAFYNNQTYVVGLGSSLPTSTDRYQKELDVINQQKNAGIASYAAGMVGKVASVIPGVGGIVGSALNLSGARKELDIAQTLPRGSFGDLRLGSGLRDAFYYKNNLLGSVVGTLGAGINSVGGIIGDSLNFANFLKMNELQKRNAGIGYITTTTDDMLSAIINQQSINNDNESWITRGFYSVIYKKKFDLATRNNLYNYFNMFGFQVNDFFPISFINNISIFASNTSVGYGKNIGYFELDEEWIRSKIDIFKFWDNRVKESIIQQLSNGIRMYKFD